MFHGYYRSGEEVLQRYINIIHVLHLQLFTQNWVKKSVSVYIVTPSSSHYNIICHNKCIISHEFPVHVVFSGSKTVFIDIWSGPFCTAFFGSGPFLTRSFLEVSLSGPGLFGSGPFLTRPFWKWAFLDQTFLEVGLSWSDLFGSGPFWTRPFWVLFI